MTKRRRWITRLFAFMVTFAIGLAVSMILLAVRIDSVFRTPAPEVIRESRPNLPDSHSREDDGYYLRNNATEYQVTLFGALLTAHQRHNIEQTDERSLDYATVIAQNFIADFFTLTNKDSRSDVGGVQFVAEDVRANFQTYAVDNFYLYLNHHIERFGMEALPEIVDITVDNVDFKMRYDDGKGRNLDEPMQTIIVDATWEFAQTTLEEIDGFQTSARITLIETDEGLRIKMIEEIDLER